MAGPPATGGIIRGGKSGGGKKGPAMAGPGVPASSPLLDPSSSLSGQDLYAAAKALADAQVSGPYSELARQIAANQQQTTNAEKLTGGYFNQFGQQAQQGYKDEGQIAGQLSSQLAGIGQGTQQQLAGLGQGAQASLSKYTPGADASLANPAMQSLTTELARQQGLAAQSSGIQQGAGAIQGANYRGLAASNLGTGALAGQETLGNIAQAGQLRNEPLSAKQAALRESEGAILASDIGKLRQQEITNRITTAGLGIDQARIAEAAAASTATQQGENSRAAAAQKAAWRREQAIIAGENNRNASTIAGENSRAAAARAEAAAKAQSQASAAGKSKALPQSEQNTLYKQLDSAISHIPTLQANGLKDSKGNVLIPHPSQAQITNALVSAGWPAGLVQAAFQLRQFGYITPGVAKQLRAMGLRGGFYNGKPIRVRPAPVSAGGAVGAAAGGVGAGAAGAGNAVGQAGRGAAGGIAGAAG